MLSKEINTVYATLKYNPWTKFGDFYVRTDGNGVPEKHAVAQLISKLHIFYESILY
jgi:hypothetical protein